MTAPNPFTAAELDELSRLTSPDYVHRLIPMARRAIELEARVAELDAENARRKEHEAAALNEMAKARGKVQDVQASLDWWRCDMYERGEETGLVKKLWDKAKELERRVTSDGARITEIESDNGVLTARLACPDCHDGGACLPGGCGVEGCERCGKPCPTCNGSCELDPAKLLARIAELETQLAELRACKGVTDKQEVSDGRPQ